MPEDEEPKKKAGRCARRERKNVMTGMAGRLGRTLLRYGLKTLQLHPHGASMPLLKNLRDWSWNA